MLAGGVDSDIMCLVVHIFRKYLDFDQNSYSRIISWVNYSVEMTQYLIHCRVQLLLPCCLHLPCIGIMPDQRCIPFDPEYLLQHIRLHRS